MRRAFVAGWVATVVACALACGKPATQAPATQAVDTPAAAVEVEVAAAKPPTPAPAVPNTTTARPEKQPTQPQQAPAPSLPPFANTTLDQDEILRVLLEAPVSRFRPVGTSSIVFRATQNGTFDAAFKSSSEERPNAHAAEIGAYRTARVLGLDNVPPAITRRFTEESMRSRMQPFSAWTELQSWIGLHAGHVNGASIYWIDGMRDSDIDTRAGTRRYTAWLGHDGTIDEGDLALARDVSNMIAFDCLIGNWDRWSGGNAKGDQAGKRLYIRDHDVAFPGRLSEALLRRLFDRLAPVERFSKDFVARLRTLDRARFQRELALDPAGSVLLDAKQIDAMLDRRAAVLSHVDSLIVMHGTQSILFFP